jgi:hypothetical protein
VTSTGHVPNRTDTGRSAYRREVVCSERGRRERVRESGDHGVKAIATQLREVRKRDSQRHDGTRLAHARCRLTRVTEWGLGSPGFTRRVSAQADPRRRKLPFGVGPENGGARENDQRRERSGSTE